MELISQTLGKRVRECREARGWRQRDLAVAMDVDSSYVSMIETDSIANPGIETLEKIARALGCTPNDLLGFDSHTPTVTPTPV